MSRVDPFSALLDAKEFSFGQQPVDRDTPSHHRGNIGCLLFRPSKTKPSIEKEITSYLMRGLIEGEIGEIIKMEAQSMSKAVIKEED